MSTPPAVIRSSLHKLSYYPLIIIFCWSITSYNDLASLVYRFPITKTQQQINLCSNIIPILQGLLLSCVFFLKNTIVRERWGRLFCRTTGVGEEAVKVRYSYLPPT